MSTSGEGGGGGKGSAGRFTAWVIFLLVSWSVWTHSFKTINYNRVSHVLARTISRTADLPLIMGHPVHTYTILSVVSSTFHQLAVPCHTLCLFSCFFLYFCPTYISLNSLY